MAEIIYELLFMLPLCFIGTILSLPYLGNFASRMGDFAGLAETAAGTTAAATGNPVSPVLVHLTALLVLGVLMVCKHWKNRLKYLLPGILITTVAVLVFLHKKETRMEYIVQNLWVVHTALMAVGAFLAGWMLSAKLWMRRITSVAVITLLILNMVLWKTDAKAAVVLGLFIAVLCVADEVQHGWKKSGYTDAKKHLVYIAPFLLIFAIGIFALPAPEKPLDWSAVVRFGEKAMNYFKTKTVGLHEGEEDYEAMIGFSDEGLFVGSLGKNAKEVMNLTTASGGERIIYLGGKTLDTFDGRVWSESYTEANHDKRMDTLELLCAITAFDEKNETDYIRRTSVKLQFMDFYTRYCFTPEKLIPTDNAISLTYYTEEGGELISGKELGYGSEYTAFYYRLNRGNEVFGDFLEHSGEIDKKTWDGVRNRYLPEENLPYEEYLAYRERIKATYLPITQLSPQAESYLEELTADGEQAVSDYETLCRIEEALSKLNYTTTPGNLPESISSQADFLDYFLFEKQEGYCSFFATAFVLMARNRGIPARVVHGFRVNTNGKKETQVKSDTAHAWAEAYIDGVGWFIFDPTPGSETGNYWLTRDESASYNPPEKMPEIAKEQKDSSAVTPIGEETTAEKKGFFNWKWALILVISAVIFGVLYFILYKVISGALAKKRSPEEQFLASVKKNFRVLEILGYQRKSGETLEEFRSRVEKKIAPENLDFIGDYELICYSDKTVGEEQHRECEKDFEALLSLLKNTKGKGLMWLYLRIYYA